MQNSAKHWSLHDGEVANDETILKKWSIAPKSSCQINCLDWQQRQTGPSICRHVERFLNVTLRSVLLSSPLGLQRSASVVFVIAALHVDFIWPQWPFTAYNMRHTLARRICSLIAFWKPKKAQVYGHDLPWSKHGNIYINFSLIYNICEVFCACVLGAFCRAWHCESGQGCSKCSSQPIQPWRKQIQDWRIFKIILASPTPLT